MTTFLLAALLLAGAAPAGAAPQEASATQTLTRSAVSAGGGASASSTNGLTLTIGEEVADSTAASSTRLIRPGLQQISASPGAVTDLAARADVSLTSMTVTWTDPGVDGPLGPLPAGTSFYIRVASYTVPDTFAFSKAQLVVSTGGAAAGAADSAGATGLLHNTVYSFGLWTVDPRGNVSTGSVLGTGSTLADPPVAIAGPFLFVYSASVTVRWAALPASPPEATAEGYTVEASSTNFGALSPGGVVSSSTTYDVAVTTLSVNDPALISDKLYYFRVASLNWNGDPDYTSLGSVKTAFEAQPPAPVDPPYTSVSSGSIVANWDRNGNPTATVYELDASLSPSFASYSSSTTFNVYAATTTLSPNTTYYFRVNASSSASVTAFVSLGSTMTYRLTPATAASTFSAVGPHGLTVSWSNGGNPAGSTPYSVVLSTEPSYPNADSGNVALTTTPAGALPTGTVTGSAPNTTYYAFVASLNSIGAPSPYAALGSTVTPAAAPLTAAPAFAGLTTGGFSAIWNPDGNPLSVTTYTVEASTSPTFDAGTQYSVSFDTVPDGASVSFSGLRANTTYFVRARAHDLSGDLSAYAALGSTSTLPVAPSGPTFGAVEPTPTSIRLDWADALNGPGTAYRAFVSTAADFGSGAAVTTHTVFTTFLSTAGLSVNTTYFLAVSAVGNDGSLSASVSASTPTRANVPAAFATIFTGVGQSSFTALWSPNGNPLSVTTYTVDASTASDFNAGVFDEVSFTTAPAGASPAASFTGLSAGTTYYFRVNALSRAGGDSAYAVLGATSTRALAPGSPGFGAAATSSMTVTWTPVSGSGYEILASSTNFGALLPGGVVRFSSGAGSGLSQLGVYGLSANTTYFVRVGAYDWGGNATLADAGGASTLATPVTGTTLRIYATSATVTWVPRPASPQSSSAEGYLVEAATAASVASPSDFTGTILSSASYGVLPSTLTVDGLDAGATYTFRVGVYNWSNGVNDAAPVSGVTAITDFVWSGGSGLWNTNTNWTPTGVPGAGSRVTIDQSVTVTASGSGISFYALTLGDSAGTFAPVLVVSTSISRGRDLLVHPGATFTQDLNQALNFSGDATFETGSVLNHTTNGTTPQTSAVDFSVAGTFTLQAGATVAASGLGFNGGAANGGSGVILNNGGGIGNSASSAGGSGAGHGGGGGAEGINPGGSVYDSLTNPNVAGSGGGGGDRVGGGAGGQGGGLVVIQAGTIQLDGLVTTDGLVGGGGGTSAATRGAGGGGSGGAVNLSADFFAGAGTVTALGGDGGLDNDGGDDPGGGGGGGRVALAANLSGTVCDVTVAVDGGAAGGGGGTAFAGSSGTVYTVSSFLPPAGFAGVAPTSTTMQWTWSLSAYGKNYQLFSSTGGAVSPVLGPTAVSYLETGLLANTTYTRYVTVSGCGSTADSPVASRSTLAAPPTALATSFTSVQVDNIGAGWEAIFSPQDQTSEGFVLEASTTNFGALTPGGVVTSSATGDVAVSTLTIAYPPLSPNTTYYFRVAALNWAGELSSYTALGSTSTLALAPTRLSSDFLSVYSASVTVRWAALAASPPSLSAEGFIVDASSTNFGALSPGGVVSSSATADPRVSTLTVNSPALVTNQLYYFRVGSLNWNGAVNYTLLSSTVTPLQMQVPLPDSPAYADVSSGSIVARWLRNGNPDSSLYELDASLDPGFSVYSSTVGFAVFAATTTLAPNTTYYFRVRASSNTGASSFADLGSTMTYSFPPAAAAGAFTGVTAHRFTVSWLNGGNPAGVSTYTVIATTDTAYPNGDAGNLSLSTIPAGAFPAATLASAPNTTYYVFVAAWNDAGALSAPLSAGRLVTPAATPLSAASTFTAVASDGFTAIWDADGNPVSVTTYTVEASTASDFTAGPLGSVSFDTVTAGPSVSFTGLDANTTYFFRVKAVNHAGASTSYANLGSTVTLAGTPAPAVAGVFLSSLTVTWPAVGAARFDLTASSTNFGALLPGGAVAFSSAAGSGTVALPALSLASNTTYFLRLTAYNWNGVPTTVTPAPTSTLAPAVAAPQVYAVFATSATVNWKPLPSAPQSSSAEGYIVEASTAASVASPSDFTGVIFSSISYGVSLSTLTLTGLDAGSTYTFRVGALNWAGAENPVTAGSGVTAVTDYVWSGGAGTWDTATNWTPNGVPSGGSRVTIDQSVTVTANGNAIRFFTLTLGDPSGTFSPVLIVSTAVATARDMVVHPNATFTQGAVSTFTFTGDVTFEPGSLLNHSATGTSPQGAEVNFDVAGTFTLSAGATAAVSGLGFNGGNLNGGIGTIVGGGGGSGSSASSAGGAGGGHGGSGGGAGLNSGGIAYDSGANPVLVGGGGGGGDGTSGGVGGKGGGAVLVRAGTMQIDGLISADGATGGTGPGGNAALCAGGGGAGGAVNLSADFFAGAGTITALGGTGGGDTDLGDDPGGGGGGGRVSVSAGTSGSACDLTISLTGGSSGGGTSSNGNAGTFSSTSTFQAPAGFAGVSPTSTTVQWTWTAALNGKNYQVMASTGGPVSPLLGSAAVSYLETGLLANTTYARYVRVSGCGSGADSSVASRSTLAAPPAALPFPFPSILTDRIDAAWAGLPASPPEQSSEGFVVEASSTNFGALTPGGVASSNSTADPAVSTLTVLSPALAANTTYYFRVAALNWAGELSSYTVLGATCTLAEAPSALAFDYLAVFETSATIQWAALPASPSAASAEGYILQASTTNFGADSPGGVTISSITRDIAVSTLTIAGLDPAATTYMRVGSLNHNSTPDFLDLLRLHIQISPSILDLSLGTMNPSVSMSTVSVSSYVITNSGTLPLTFELRASTATPQSPWILGASPDIETVVLQGLWNSVQPPAGSFVTPITNSTTTSSGVNYAGDQTGVTVLPGQSRTLWFRFQLPSTTATSTFTQTMQLGVVPAYP